MRLLKCYIENFGILRTQEFSFSKGLNCCISENGTGKTTLTAFIESMLYGIGDTRRQSLDENPRKKYSPWQGGRFGGSLTVEVGKKRYVIERTFGARPADDTFRLIDADSGRVSNDYGEDIGEKLFGIDRDGFLRTVFLSEKNLQGKNENKSISAKLSDLVGVDGDVGGFDDALKLLEDRRKFYYKKGNSGEIANVKERINECQRKLDNVTRLEDEARAKEERARELRAARARISAVEEDQKLKLDELRKMKERGASEERYATMLEALNKEKARLGEVKSFFSKYMPTSHEVDAARDAFTESNRLKAEALSEEGSEEYVTLSEFFKEGTSFIEISEAEKAAERAAEISREVAIIDSGSDPSSVEMRKIFPLNAPTWDDIDKMEKAAKSSGGFLRAVGVLIGLLIAAGGAILGGTIGYSIAAVGALVSILSVIFLGKSKKSKEMLALARNFNGCDCSNLSSIVDELKRKLTRYEAMNNDKEKTRERLVDELSCVTLKVCDFLSKFPIVSADSMLDSVQIIKHKYTQFYALSKAGEASASGKIEKLKRSEALNESARDFLARFPTTSDNPFAEIRDKLSDLSYLSASVARLERECDVYAVKYGVTGKIVSADLGAESAVNATLEEAASKSKAIAEEMALINRELTVLRAEIEKKDEYAMAKEELEELYQKHVESLEIIKKTSFFLKEACDNITAKYLGKAKERFNEYSSLITGSEGEYTLSTSFELTKTERGEAHGIEAFSRGTRDLYALSLRLALVDALYDQETPFIILDDPFLALDDAKLERAKATLKTLGKSKQILYFTCTKARAIE